MSSDAEQTPIDRPLTRGDLNDVRRIVHNIAERQIAMFQDIEQIKEVMAGFIVIHDRTMRIEQRMRWGWVPVAVSTFLLVLNSVVTMLR